MDFKKNFYYELYHNILFLSCKYNQKQYFNKALNYKKININETDSNGLTALIYASKTGNVNIINQLLIKKANVNVRDKYGRTALLRACKNGHLDIVEKLLEYEADVRIKGSIWIYNCFDYAYINNNLEIIDCLLNDYIINITNKDSFNSTVLIWASYRNRLDVVNLILKNKKRHIKNCNYEIDINGKTALFHSIDNNYISVFNKIIDYIDKNKKFPYYVIKKEKDSLIHAFLQNNPIIIDRIFKYVKININMINFQKRTVLMQSSENGHIENIKRILNYGLHNKNKIKVLTDEQKLNNKYLININLQDIDRKTALILACENRNVNIVKLFLEYELKEVYFKSMDINLQDINGKHVLLIASENGYTEIVELFLEYSIKCSKYININLQDDKGFTSLMYASNNGYINISILLLKNEKINLFIKDYYYNKTALEWALVNRNFIIVEYIIEKEKDYYKKIFNIILKNIIKEEKSLLLINSLITSFSISFTKIY